LGTVGKLKTELDKRGFRTKLRKTLKQQQVGGRPFSRGHLYKLLSNPVYIGKVCHKHNIYDGEHGAIIETEFWEKIQALLKSNAPKRKRNINLKSGSLLTGLIYDQSGDRLSPIHTKKNGRKYRYYISNRLTKGELDDGSAWRLPANQIEGKIMKLLRSTFSDQSVPIHLLNLNDPTHSELRDLKETCHELDKKLSNPNPNNIRKTLIDLVNRIEVHNDELIIMLRRKNLLNDEENQSLILRFPLQQKRRGVETKLVIGGRPQNTPDTKLIQTIAQARHWYEQLKSNRRKSILEIAKSENVDASDVSRTLPLAFLAPDIVHEIICGNQPIELTTDSIKRKTAHLPSDWNDQRVFLGFPA
ncbi:MAG: hypothetical protein EX271_08435, partial [Acidimicrobiales bacterium]